MATRPLPAGTRNGSVNAAIDTWADFGRVAAMRNTTMSELLRGYMEHEIRTMRIRTGEIIRDARQMVLPFALCLVVAVGVAAGVVAAALGQNEIRTVRRAGGVRVVHTIRELKRCNRRKEESWV